MHWANVYSCNSLTKNIHVAIHVVATIDLDCQDITEYMENRSGVSFSFRRLLILSFWTFYINVILILLVVLTEISLFD